MLIRIKKARQAAPDEVRISRSGEEAKSESGSQMKSNDRAGNRDVESLNMARAYDPLNAPDPDDWQAMREDECMALVMEHHREAGVELPNEQIHAVIHVVVENQIALGDETSVRATLARLMREGLDRHEAIHAIGSVLMDFVQDLLGGDAPPESNQRYDEGLGKLTAAGWLEAFR
jgi:hypothetical protein